VPDIGNCMFFRRRQGNRGRRLSSIGSAVPPLTKTRRPQWN
jgi:hypothetical protein